MFKKIPFLLLLYSVGLFADPLIVRPQANDDYASVTVGPSSSVSVDLAVNDRYGSIVTLNGSPSGQYGSVQLSGTAAVYTPYDNSTNKALVAGQVVTDTFSYSYANSVGQSASASLTVRVTGDPQAFVDTSSSGSGGTIAAAPPAAFDDNATVVPNTTALSTAQGNVTKNDKDGVGVYLNGAPVSDYGYLVLNSDGSFIYTLYVNSPSINGLAAGAFVTDTFSYTYYNSAGLSTTAQLKIMIIGNPVDANGKTVFAPPAESPLDNVDVEFNNRSKDSVPLNSGRNIVGHLYSESDVDWYSIQSVGDEIIKFSMCPLGSSCYLKGSWVMYVFDSALLTAAMESENVDFNIWVDDTGSTKDILGNDILFSNIIGSSNHMYLAYKAGIFEGALIGIQDPCFDIHSNVEMGVGKGARKYLIAISSPLMGGDQDGQSTGKCGEGSVILRRPGASVAGVDADGKPKTYTTTEEYISVFPYSDDQYTINITGTGVNPLLSEEAAAKSATFNSKTGVLKIPKLRSLGKLYKANLALNKQSAPSDGAIKFALSSIKELGPKKIADGYQATFNPDNQQVMIPRVTNLETGEAYSVVLQYRPKTSGKDAILEVVNATLIK